MVIKILFLTGMSVLLLACGRGDSHLSLGDGYFYSDVSPIGQRIVKSDGGLDIVVDTAVIDYIFDSNFIVGVRVPSVTYKCRSKQKSLSGAYATDIAFIDALEYVVVDKNNSKTEVFDSFEKLNNYLVSVKFSKEVKLNVEGKSRVLNISSMDRIDTNLCSRVD
jgi:hypothetical protein